MLLLHMQIRRYFNKICDKAWYNFWWSFNFISCFEESKNNFYISWQCTYIVFILQCHVCKFLLNLHTHKFWSFDDNVKSSVITEKDNTTNDKFAYSQIKQDGLEFQILGTIWLLDFPDLSRLIPMHPPPICQYDGTINDCHTRGRFDPPFSGKCLYQVGNMIVVF